MAFMCPKRELDLYNEFLMDKNRDVLKNKVTRAMRIFFLVSSLFLRIDSYFLYYIGLLSIFFGAHNIYAFKNDLPFGDPIPSPNLPRFEKERYDNYQKSKLAFVIGPFLILFALDLPLFYPIWERDISWDAFTDVLAHEFEKF